MAAAIRNALKQQEGSLLAFLPGVREIERTSDALGDLPDDIVLHRLHGGVDPAAQRAALARLPPARESWCSRVPSPKPVSRSMMSGSSSTAGSRAVRVTMGAGLTRLVTERASQAAVTQRAGRAARQAPGRAVRLWEEAATQALPAHDPPEILEADLTALTLSCLLWGESDPSRLPFLDPPPDPALAEARTRLTVLGAIDGEGRIIDHGRAIAAIPLEPRLAHMLLVAGEQGLVPTAAAAAALLTERGLGGRIEDLEQRFRHWSGERSRRAEAARKLAGRWGGRGRVEPDRLGEAVALAFPDRLARRRGASGEDWQSVGGRGFRLNSASPLASAEWLAIAEVAGAAKGARILSAARIEEAQVETKFADRIQPFSEVRYDSAAKRITATHGTRLGAITLTSASDPDPDEAAILKGLLHAVQREGLGILPWNTRGKALRTRAQFARTADRSLPDLSDSALLESVSDWLAPLLAGQRRLNRIDTAALTGTLEGLAGFAALQRIDALAPARLETPAGTSHAIDYDVQGGPIVEVRAQALYGLTDHPMAGAVPIVLAITSPAGRPIQTTTDLPAFWAGSWVDVAKDMRGRYPKHDWPDDPANARADLRTKRAR